MKKNLNTKAGIYERDTNSANEWVIEMYAPNPKEDKWITLAFPKVLAKSNGGYDYQTILTKVLDEEVLDKLKENKIHFSPKARYVRVLGMHDYSTSYFISAGLASKLKNIKVKFW